MFYHNAADTNIQYPNLGAVHILTHKFLFQALNPVLAAENPALGAPYQVRTFALCVLVPFIFISKWIVEDLILSFQESFCLAINQVL